MSTEPTNRNRTPGPTKGPWVEFNDDRGRTTAILPAGRAGEVCSFATPFPSRANARLIAASPTMYEFIKTLADGGNADAAAIIAKIL